MDCCRYCNDSLHYCMYSNIASIAMIFWTVAKFAMIDGLME
ncbi:hypothetical protein OPT79_62 [Klebsiella phage vB_KpnD_Opt-79]|uniref:Uncharacterized protein n=1 Tax=Escherichia phage vB_EcoD_Sadiya TaxID=2902684 RepID=A0AC61TRK6_9CAUD|nr:hypothetical protein OPT79_62 [Klebsiella phage vB_KpnD_Opt-79]UGV22584.1 hypothetical protein PHLEASOLO_63 [Escherichia phage vB_ EcoD_Phleasolo]UGV22752.1 hypothetical protein SADIYA_63 [Escherichia phage vB_EcoD_Sadiya]